MIMMHMVSMMWMLMFSWCGQFVVMKRLTNRATPVTPIRRNINAAYIVTLEMFTTQLLV